MESGVPFRVVASDMDGTLLDPNHDITPYTMETLFQLSVRYGVAFVFATGRHHFSVRKARAELSAYFTTRYAAQAAQSASGSAPPGFFLVTSNGARIHDPQGNLIVSHDLDADIVKALYVQYGLPYTARHGPQALIERAIGSSPYTAVEDLGAGKGADAAALMEGDDENPEEPVSTSAYTTDTWFITAPFMPLAEMERKFGVRPTVVPFDAEGPANAAGSVFDGFPLDGVGKVCFRCSDRHILDSMERNIKAQFGNRLSVALSSTRCLDVMASGISKASALKEIVSLLSRQNASAAAAGSAPHPLTMKDVIAFGDSMNDELMLESVGKGCIMENAHDRLKRTLPTCEVIGTNDKDGVAVKLREVFQLPLDA